LLPLWRYYLVNIINCIKVTIPDHDHNAAINILNRAVGTTDKSYEIHEPVEVRGYPARIEILSYLGPLSPLNKDKLMDENISSGRYKNRIIGDFLKELHLTEDRNTGFRKIRKALEYNGSPQSDFNTDDERSYFLTVLMIYPEAQVELIDTQIDILSGCVSGPRSKK
jgi:ATP-dependent DNA helicase RecG